MQLKRSFIYLFFLSVIITVWSCGRTKSRYLGKEYRQVLEINNMQQFINISFDKRGVSTVKDVTFLATDGYVYTKEFKDVSPLEGIIRWVPYGEGSSLIQSRALSRWTGKAVNVELPKDCARILCVDVSYSSGNERVKNLCYLSSDGRIYAKEYKDGIISRHLSGWLEIKVKQKMNKK